MICLFGISLGGLLSFLAFPLGEELAEHYSSFLGNLFESIGISNYSFVGFIVNAPSIVDLGIVFAGMTLGFGLMWWYSRPNRYKV
jgi:hypothetical protein